MTGYEVKGRCPGALRPMLSGDGLLVRVRPRLGRLSAAQALGLCEAAGACGTGLIELTNRANLQLRGVRERALPALQARLDRLGLLDPDPRTEGQRNMILAPDWRAGDDSHRIADDLLGRLGELPDLPPKVGFAVDAGAAPILQSDPADFRVERGAGGGLILRPDGRRCGLCLESGREAAALVELAHWFVAGGGGRAGRMARHGATLPAWPAGHDRPAPARPPIRPGRHPLGRVLGLAFGQVEAAALAQFLAASRTTALRLTPWRLLLAEDAGECPAPGLLDDAEAPALRADACPGAPCCPQATVATRPLALSLAPHVAGRLHVSGCAKGCARSRPADVVLTGRDGAFDLARNARAGAEPEAAGLSPARALALFGAC